MVTEARVIEVNTSVSQHDRKYSQQRHATKNGAGEMRDEWLPIETAPRDGTPLLIFVPNGWNMFVARWEEGAHRPSYRDGLDRDTREVIVVPEVNGAWVAGGDMGNDETIEFFARPHPGPYPTHWLPLPPPPLNKSETI